jgi:predicted TIM-barrel fold metal-dependent hydrolase
MAMLGVSFEDEVSQEALRRHPDRFFAAAPADPNRGMEGVRDIVRLHEDFGVRAVHAFPCGTWPQVPIGHARWYPIFAKCVELGLVFNCCVGVPGPRIPMAPQIVDQLDEICWFFPDLKFVMRHGAEPWEELAVKLMLKYPNLYYSTSAFAPRHYPRAIVDFANTRGADKILYAGYFPAGLTLERIFADMPQVPFRDDVWPKFLRTNAVRLFGLAA